MLEPVADTAREPHGHAAEATCPATATMTRVITFQSTVPMLSSSLRWNGTLIVAATALESFSASSASLPESRLCLHRVRNHRRSMSVETPR